MSIERTSQNEVADRAYQLWEKAGRPQGRDLEFWLQAEAEIRNSASSEAAPRQIAPAESLPQIIPSPRPKTNRVRGVQSRMR